LKSIIQVASYPIFMNIISQAQQFPLLITIANLCFLFASPQVLLLIT